MGRKRLIEWSLFSKGWEGKRERKKGRKISDDKSYYLCITLPNDRIWSPLNDQSAKFSNVSNPFLSLKTKKQKNELLCYPGTALVSSFLVFTIFCFFSYSRNLFGWSEISEILGEKSIQLHYVQNYLLDLKRWFSYELINCREKGWFIGLKKGGFASFFFYSGTCQTAYFWCFSNIYNQC